jgi:hypothetical protein
MSAESAMGLPLFLLSAQVRGLIFPGEAGEVFTFGLDLRGWGLGSVRPAGEAISGGIIPGAA